MTVTAILSVFVANCVFLCISCAAYCAAWVRTSTRCIDDYDLVTVVYGLSAVVYGLGCVIGVIIYYKSHVFVLRKCSVPTLITGLTAIGLVFSVVSTVVLIFTLSFHFDTDCLQKTDGKILFAFLWVIEAMAIASNGLLMLFSLCTKTRDVPAPAPMKYDISPISSSKKPIPAVALAV